MAEIGASLAVPGMGRGFTTKSKRCSIASTQDPGSLPMYDLQGFDNSRCLSDFDLQSMSFADLQDNGSEGSLTWPTSEVAHLKAEAAQEAKEAKETLTYAEEHGCEGSLTWPTSELAQLKAEAILEARAEETLTFAEAAPSPSATTPPQQPRHLEAVDKSITGSSDACVAASVAKALEQIAFSPDMKLLGVDMPVIITDWSVWEGRRRRRQLQSRKLARGRYGTMLDDHSLGHCSSDCTRCKI